MDSTSSNEPSICVPWNRLRQWIDAQESAEMQTGQPQLPRSQIAAISHLVPFVDDEPDVSDTDYVSNLMLFTQSRRITVPVFADLEPVVVPIEGTFVPRWRCVCLLPMQNETFPCEGFGFEQGREAPVFQSKRNAKQFAAKQALACLSNKLPKRVQPLNSVLNQPQPRQPKPPNGHTSNTSKSTPRKSPTAAASTTPIPSPPPNMTPNSDANASILEQVATLSQRLGVDSPAYVIEPESDTPNFFCGRPAFQNAGRVPLELGVVSNVYGKKQAKIQVAELVLEWLQVEVQKRQDFFTSCFE